MTKEKRPNQSLPGDNEPLNNNNLEKEESQTFPFKSLDEKLTKAIQEVVKTPKEFSNSAMNWIIPCLEILKEFRFQKEYKDYYERKRLEIIKLGLEKGVNQIELTNNLNKFLNNSNYSKLINSLENLFDNNLVWDIMLNKLRWNGKPIALTNFQALMERFMDTKLNTDEFKRITSYYSQHHEYNAIQSYLTGLEPVNDPELVLEQFYDLLGVSEPMHKIYIRKWLISAVARGLNPGCKADHVLILKSPQGFKKTSFFQSLAGNLFQTYGNSGNDKDDLMSLYRSWICEFGEVSHTFSKQGNDKLKAFITSTHDCFRRPYTPDVEEYPRHFIFAATVNDDTFLSDRTGNRRYWIVELFNKINLQDIKNLRDELWSAIKLLYENGEQWWLTDDEEGQQKIDNEKYEEDNPYIDAIRNYFLYHGEPKQIDPEKGFTMYDAMIYILQMNPKDTKDKKAERELGDALRKLDFNKSQKRISGKVRKVWIKNT